MQKPITQQDMQLLLDNLKKYLMQRMVSRYDVQTISESVRDRLIAHMQAMHTENQQIIRQGAIFRTQMWNKALTLETRLASLEMDIRTIKQLMGQVSQQQQDTHAVASNVYTSMATKPSEPAQGTIHFGGEPQMVPNN